MNKTRKRRASQNTKNENVSSSGEAANLTAVQLAQIERSYRENASNYKALLEEVVFILKSRLAAEDVKIHGIERRIKELPSVEAKCQRKNTIDLSKLVDIVGARIICLFRSDMSKVGELIRANFDIEDVDDKISAGGPLGYMSVHYICKIPDRYSGPRYENTRDVRFEIQVRTLCMHAWAAVSHYLDYKGEWDVPEDLKRALSALGGLFYVADNEFEQFYKARLTSKLEAERPANESQEINLDTMASFLVQTFPDRKHSELNDISDLVHEIKQAGYASMKQIGNDLVRGQRAFEVYEQGHPPSPGPRYTDVGVVRVTLRIVSESMREKVREHFQETTEDYEELLPLVNPIASLR